MVQRLKTYWTTPEVEAFYKIDNVEREILLPYVAELVNGLNPVTLLDYGCGNGYLASLVKADTEISLYDINAEVIENCRRWNITNTVKLLTQKDEIPVGYFDVVVQTSVLMCIPTLEGIRSVFKDVYTALKEGGSAVIAVTHPCFLQYQFGHYHTSYHHGNFNYLEDAATYEVYMKHSDQDPVVFTDYNWSLSTLLNEMTRSGLILAKMVEHPDLESKYYQPNKLVSPWLFLIAKKAKHEF